MTKTIIVGTDFSKGSIVALEVAIDIANKLDANIQLVWVCKEKNLFSTEQTNSIRHLAMEKLENLVSEYQPKLKDKIINPLILNGKVASILAEQAKKMDASMIVIGTNGASGFEKYWMGSTAVRIVQEANCPTLSIREGFNFHKNLEHILVPLNMTMNSRQKLPTAVKMAKIFNSQIHVLGLSTDSSEEPTIGVYLKQAKTFLEKENIRYSIDSMRSKNIAEDVLLYANTIHADLIVITTEQEKVLSSLFIGTNAQQIVHHSLIPVLSVHPEDIGSLSR